MKWGEFWKFMLVEDVFVGNADQLDLESLDRCVELSDRDVFLRIRLCTYDWSHSVSFEPRLLEVWPCNGGVGDINTTVVFGGELPPGVLAGIYTARLIREPRLVLIPKDSMFSKVDVPFVYTSMWGIVFYPDQEIKSSK